MRKILSITLIMIMAISLVGCNNEKNTESETTGVSDVIADIAKNKSNMFTSRDKEIGYDAQNATMINGSDKNISITKEGTYVISGNVTGQIVVDVANTEKVQICLNNANITTETTAAIYVKEAGKVFVTLEGKNTISVTGEFVAVDNSNIDGAIFSKSDITFNGKGSLTVNCEKGHGIVSKDDVKITSGNYEIISAKDGISGKDSVRIAEGNISIKSEGDGIASKNDTDEGRGYIYIEGGNFHIVSGGGNTNGISNGNNGFRPGFNNNTSQTDTVSCKGIKSSNVIYVCGGTFDIDSADDAIHSNASIVIENGDITITSGDDGIHADTSVNIMNGKVNIKKSYEGIEGQNITISGGTVDVVANDDGFNAAGGNDMSSVGGRPGMNNFNSSADSFIKIEGGTLTINASGDGIDCNGSIYVTGGTTYVYGPTNSGNGAIDSGEMGEAKITGGVLIALGSSGMATGFGQTSTQGSILYNMNSGQAAGTTVEIKDSTGKVLAGCNAEKTYSSVVISAPGIKTGETYTLTMGTENVTITMDAIVYSNGGYGNMGNPGNMNPGGNRPGGMMPGNNPDDIPADGNRPGGMYPGGNQRPGKNDNWPGEQETTTEGNII